MEFNIEPDVSQVKGIDQLKDIDVPADRILIDGSGVMALYGIRQNTDLDIAVPMIDWMRLSRSGKFEFAFGGYQKIVVLRSVHSSYTTDWQGAIENGNNWGGMSKDEKYMPPTETQIEIHYHDWDHSRTEDSLKRTPLIGGYHFHTLETIYQWKKMASQDKHIADCLAIEKYWAWKKSKELNENIIDDIINKKLSFM